LVDARGRVRVRAPCAAAGWVIGWLWLLSVQFHSNSQKFHHIKYLHGVLNINGKKPIKQFACKLRDESFEPNCNMI
jgi:hypothetical protein